MVNRGKKSVSLDLKSDEGTEAFYQLVETADVVFEQFRPGVVERLGIDYDTLRSYNDELIYCSLTGYGQEGPGPIARVTTSTTSHCRVARHDPRVAIRQATDARLPDRRHERWAVFRVRDHRSAVIARTREHRW